MNNIVFQYFKTPYGELKIASFNGGLCMCDWRYRKLKEAVDQRVSKMLDAVFIEGSTELIEETKKQLQEYFARERRNFNIPLLLAGSDFQKKVWETLLKIPYGQTETYLGLAERLGEAK